MMITYNRLNKKDGQILTEADLLHMEDGIYNSSITLSEHLENHPSAEHTHDEFKTLRDHIENHPVTAHSHDEFKILADHLENHPTTDYDFEGLEERLDDMEEDIDDQPVSNDEILAEDDLEEDKKTIPPPSNPAAAFWVLKKGKFT